MKKFTIPLNNEMACIAILLILIGVIFIWGVGWGIVGLFSIIWGAVAFWLAHQFAIAPVWEELVRQPVRHRDRTYGDLEQNLPY